MLDTLTDAPLDSLEQELIACEALISRVRSRQAELLRDLDTAQVHTTDGARSMTDWIAARLDVSHDTARQMLDIARRLPEHEDIAQRLETGEITVERALATARLAAAGAPLDLIIASSGYDLDGVRRLAARHRRFTRTDEAAAFRDRHVVMQPNLDGTAWRLWGQLSGDGGRIVAAALVERGDRFRKLPQPVPSTQGQRHADALVAIAQDALDATDAAPSWNGGDPADRSPIVTIFVDARAASSAGGEAGAEVAFGPQVGPETLQRMLCSGAVQVVGLDRGRPVVASATARAIPPAVRRFVLWRDGGCAIAGCSSRYRLQPHHIRARSAGGSHDPENLATVCWFHHHVVIHGSGFRIDPASPAQQRRLIGPTRGRDP